MADGGQCHRLKSRKEVLKLSNKELSDVCKTLGVPLKGNRNFRATNICEKLNLNTSGVDDKENYKPCPWIDKARLCARKNEGWTKDIRKMPNICLSDISSYLLNSPRHVDNKNFEIFGKETLLKYKTLRSYRLWREDHIHSLEYHDFEGDIALIRCFSLASYEKQGTEYRTFVSISKQTTKVLYGHCHCIAGLGEACTHVAGLLFAIEEFVSEGLTELPGDLTCTETLCKWIVPKGPKEAPQLVKDINFSKTYHGSTPVEKIEIKDPRPLSDRQIDNNATLQLFRDLNDAGSSDVAMVKLLQARFTCNATVSLSPTTLNDSTTLTSTQCQLPELISYDDPNFLPSFEMDIKTEYVPPTMKERIENVLMTRNTTTTITTEELTPLLTVDQSFIDTVELLTVDQSKSHLWKSYRHNVCTASNSLAICSRIDSFTEGKCSTGGSVLGLINGSSTFTGNDATRYGTEKEQLARDDYIRTMSSCHINFKCSQSGFIFHPSGYFGASPDGICSCDCHSNSFLLEIKCPFSLKEKDPNNAVNQLEFLCESDSSDEYTLRKSHKYYYQVISTMGVTKTNNCHFVVWSPHGMLIINVNQDKSKFKGILAKSKLYFEKFIIPPLMLV